MSRGIFRATGGSGRAGSSHDLPLDAMVDAGTSTLAMMGWQAVRLVFLVLWAAWWIGSCTLQDAPSAPPGTGIRGTVTLGPTCPVEQVGGPPCSTTYAATLAITRADDGTVVATVSSGDDGVFEALVPAGEYVIVPQPGGEPFPFGKPEQVTVVDGAFTEVVVSYDTGIR